MGGLDLASNASIRVVIAVIIAVSCVNCAEIVAVSEAGFDCSVALDWPLVFEAIVYR